ncbi:MAG: hypothetical protein H6843_13870 [Rhodospirillaceae bacterium]|nr:hypothetical protein [Rhodospirillaceae bacterium]
MSKKKAARPDYLTIDYGTLGVMTIDEFRQALWTDLAVLRDLHNVRYVSAPKLKVHISDRFGDRGPLRRLEDGKPI